MTARISKYAEDINTKRFTLPVEVTRWRMMLTLEQQKTHTTRHK